MEAISDTAKIEGYHAHVYFDPATRPVAERLRDTIVGRFAAWKRPASVA